MQTYRCHPALRSSKRGPVIGQSSVHLRQSDIDGACGAHCVLMALLILGVLNRGQTREMAKARGAARSMWHMVERSYFVGTGVGELRSMLTPYGKEIEAKVCRKNLIARILDVLADAGVAIVGIGNEHFSHWVLAVGVSVCEAEAGTEADSKPARLLLLDPGHGSIPLTPWNATLSVKSGCDDRHVYETPKGRFRVDVGAVLTMRKVKAG